jgi:hypothetical protein
VGPCGASKAGRPGAATADAGPTARTVVVAAQGSGPGGPGMQEPVLGRLGQAHIYRLEPLGPFLKIELDCLPLFE